jgi:N-acetylmuramic acid 6-phosphate etherase
LREVVLTTRWKVRRLAAVAPDTADGRSRLDGLVTEAWNEAGADLDLRSTRELVELMNDEDRSVPDAVRDAGDAIADAVDAIAARIRDGGRLIYVGAGTSGRLAALDAAECESTFSTPPGLVTALLAGGHATSAVGQEAAEDDDEAGAAELNALHPTPRDAVVGVSASGRTPYVLGALTAARSARALTVCVTSVRGSELARVADHEITIVVGPEVIAGSTRLKAGTAQKLVLNMLSTISMIRTGKTFGNLMVDVYATNEKLHARVHRIVRQATGADDDQVERALAATGGDAKVAIVSPLAGVDVEEARDRLARTGGAIREALEG